MIPSKINEHGAASVIRKKINEIIDHLKSLRIAESPSILARRTNLGTVLEVKTSSITATPDNVIVQRFKIKGIATSWIVCNKAKVDGTAESSTEYKVLRPYKLKNDAALPSDYKTGTLANPSAQARIFDRTVNTRDYTVSQEIYPLYEVNDFIFGINNITGGTVDDGTGSQVGWIDLNVDARHWSYTMREIEVCQSNVTRHSLAVISSAE